MNLVVRRRDEPEPLTDESYRSSDNTKLAHQPLQV